MSLAASPCHFFSSSLIPNLETFLKSVCDQYVLISPAAHLFLCVHVCLSVCVCFCLLAWVYVCACVSECLRAHVFVCLSDCWLTRMSASARVCVCLCATVSLYQPPARRTKAVMSFFFLSPRSSPCSYSHHAKLVVGTPGAPCLPAPQKYFWEDWESILGLATLFAVCVSL